MTPYDSDASKATTFMEHLRRSFHYTMEHLGPHNLPLIGRADWNDCLNLNCFSTEPGESFQTFGPSEVLMQNPYLSQVCLYATEKIMLQSAAIRA